MENNISVRKMSKILHRFGIKSGDVLALKHQSENANKDAIEAITKGLIHMGVDALVIVVNDFDDLTVLNETAMGRLGWFRLGNVAKVIKPPERPT